MFYYSVMFAVGSPLRATVSNYLIAKGYNERTAKVMPRSRLTTAFNGIWRSLSEAQKAAVAATDWDALPEPSTQFKFINSSVVRAQ